MCTTGHLSGFFFMRYTCVTILKLVKAYKANDANSMLFAASVYFTLVTNFIAPIADSDCIYMYNTHILPHFTSVRE